MMIPLIALLGLAALTAPTDTVVEVRRGDRVVVENLSGRITVGTWDRDRVEVRTDDRDRGALRVREVRGGVVVDSREGRRRDRVVDVEVRVPAWIDLQVEGRELEIEVTGIAGEVVLRNVEGDIRVMGTTGPLEVSSVDGDVSVRDARGRISVRSQGEDVYLGRVRGEIDAESGNGNVVLEDVDASSVRAETLDGDVRFDGVIRRGGSYEISVHDGDATVAIPRDAGLRASVATFDGDFSSEFPVTLERFSAGRTFEFELGDGGARLQIQVFDGEIRLIERR